MVNKQWLLLEAGSLAEPTEVAFDVNLAELGSELRDSFDGETMCFRHVLGYRIARPWYTFSVRDEEAIAIRNCPPPRHAPPPPDDAVLVVNDFGGTCTLDHGTSVFSAERGRLIGSITFSQMQTQVPPQVAEVALLLGRTEMWGQDAGTDATIRYHVIHSSEHNAITCDCVLPVDIALTQAGSDSGQHEALPPSMAPLVPVDPGCDQASVASVTYWVRMLLTMAPCGPDSKDIKRHWSTHPIVVMPTDGDASDGV